MDFLDDAAVSENFNSFFHKCIQIRDTARNDVEVRVQNEDDPAIGNHGNSVDPRVITLKLLTILPFFHPETR